MKTRDEVESLKENWRGDPCWNLPETEGFEEYREELLFYQFGCEAHWRAEHRAEILKVAERFGVRMGDDVTVVDVPTFGEAMKGLLDSVDRLHLEVVKLRERRPR